MKKIIVITMLSLMSCVYAEQNNRNKVDSTIEIRNHLQEKLYISSQELNQYSQKTNNEIFLYMFDFSEVGKSDKSVYKLVTNNIQSVANNKSLEDTIKKNWNLSSDYSKNLKLKSEHNFSNNITCKYNNGLVIKIKPYGNYSTNCPLKYIV